MRKLTRPPTITGVGPLDVFRAIGVATQPLRQTPQQFVLSTSAYAGLATNMTAPIATALYAANVPNVVKVWTELAFENVRASRVPDAPSRLRSVYASPDVYEAFSFAEMTNTAHHVHRGVVEDGAPWRLVDMSNFEIVDPPTGDEAGFAEAWTIATKKAENYWMIDDIEPPQPRFAEILVDGAITLDADRLRLLDVLMADGFIEK